MNTEVCDDGSGQRSGLAVAIFAGMDATSGVSVRGLS